MTAEAVLLIALTIGVLFFITLRRKLEQVAAQIRQLRAHALEPMTYQPVGDTDLADQLVALTAETEKAGFRMLGDYREATGKQVSPVPMRWFVDAAGTTFGWMTPFDVEGQRQMVVVLMSHELDQQTITSRAPRASQLSHPPFVDLLHVPMTTSIKDVVAKHRTRAQLDDADRGFVPVKTFDELRHELDRMRGKAIAWRKSQPASELLDADLRSLLGPQYGKLGGAMKRRLS